MASGVILTNTVDITISPPSTNVIISMDTADQFGGVWWDAGTPQKIVVPSGVDYVDIFFNCIAGTGGSFTADPECQIFINSVAQAVINYTSEPYATMAMRTGPIAVSAGDYIECVIRSNDSGTPDLDFDTMAFGAVSMERAGFVEAELSTAMTLSATAALVTWDSASFETFGSWDGGTGFVVPTGINYAIVSFNTVSTPHDPSRLEHQLLINGVIARRWIIDNSQWHPAAPSFGLMSVSAGDVITLKVAGGTNAITGDLSIEWISGVDSPVVTVPFEPIDLFSAGQTGGWYDPSDLSTLWQDSSRTVPVTAYGDPVGAMDDKSGNGNHLVQTIAYLRPEYRDPSGYGALYFEANEFLSGPSAAFGCANAFAIFQHGPGSDNYAGLLTNKSDQAADVDAALVMGLPPTSFYVSQGTGDGLIDATHIWIDRVQTATVVQDALTIVSANGTNHPATNLSFPNGAMVGRDRSIGTRNINCLVYGIISVGSSSAEILSQADREQVEDWLADKVGKTL